MLDPESGDNVMFSELTTVSDYEYDAPNFHEYYNVTADPCVPPLPSAAAVYEQWYGCERFLQYLYPRAFAC